MAYFEWQKEFETGIASVDQQHKRLVSLVNQIHDAVEAGTGDSSVAETLNALVDYARFHFSDEEQFMADIPDYDIIAHQRQHQAFVDELTALMLEYGESGNLTGIQLASFLKGWLMQHFLKDDRDMISRYRSATAKTPEQA